MEEARAYDKIKLFLETVGLEGKDSRCGSLKFPIFMDYRLANSSIEELNLSVRSFHALKRGGVDTIGDLTSKYKCTSDLKPLRNCGAKSIEEIYEKLFLYQYSILTGREQERFIKELIKLNGIVK